jgi:shikimate kinase/3-dehydroquinate synthase
MGTGKTAAGHLAAARLGLPFVDLDDAVRSRAGRSIDRIFADGGEAAFRGLERRAVASAARLSGTVVATGGGAPLDPGFGDLAAGSVVRVLTCEPEELHRRLAGSGPRPLLDTTSDVGSRVATLLSERSAAYAASGPPLDTTGLDPGVVAEELANAYREAAEVDEAADGPSTLIRISMGGFANGSSDVLIGAGLLADLGRKLEQVVPTACRVAVVADEAIARTLGTAVLDALRPTFAEAGLITIPSGEGAKSLPVLGTVWTALRDLGLGREDAIVTVGGGSALDIGGFAAATFARGLPLVCVPTTLTAMVDAAIGGKVAVDHAGVKNLAGTFHHPRLVVCDPTTLRSLPDAVLRQGMAEVIKAAVLASPLILDILERWDLGAVRSSASAVWIIEQSVRIKAAFVTRDPQDNQFRQALNLGHTFGHAIEASSGFRVPHGDAVSIGLVSAARLGAELGITDPALATRLASLLGRFSLSTSIPADLNVKAVLDATASDKKRRGSEPVYVVPSDQGAELVQEVDGALVEAALRGESNG